jgi:hypothetical protein
VRKPHDTFLTSDLPLDATHQWVNGESLLRTCVVGPLVPEPLTKTGSASTESGKEKEATHEEAEEEIVDVSFPAPNGPQIARGPSS